MPIGAKNEIFITPDVVEFHRPIGIRDDESDAEFDARMLTEKGFVPTRRRIQTKTPDEQAAWEEENRMDVKRKAIEEEVRTSQSSFSKKRKFETITNLSTAIQDVDTAVDGRLLRLSFPEAPVDFVGYAGRRMAACREEPGHTLIREYVDAHTRPQIVDVFARVNTQVQEVVRDLFDEKPEQAESRLIQFFNETCLGDWHDAKPFIRHLEPFDIQRSTLVCMLDSIFQQGKGQAAQMMELRKQNLEQARQNKQQLEAQAEFNEEQAKRLKLLETHNQRQNNQLKQQNSQLVEQAEQLDGLQTLNLEQGQKLDQLLEHAQHWNGQDNHTLTTVPQTKCSPLQSKPRQGLRETHRAAAHQLLQKLFVCGPDNGACSSDQMPLDDIIDRLQTHGINMSAIGLGKALMGLGANKLRQRQADGSLITYYKFMRLQ
jgi:hypothetical protein